MTWRGREDAGEGNPLRGFGRPGGDWRGLRPSFDNPLTWSVPMGRIMRIDVRRHVSFVIFIAVELIRAAFDGGSLSLRLAALMLAILFAIVLLHEFGHCIACRRAGGAADEILMWPLGGLAYCRPPNRWKSHLATAVGGPAVNVGIAAVLIPILGLATGAWFEVAIPNPLSFGGLYHEAVAGSWALSILYLAGHVNIIILLFNLLPIFPLDGGRIAQACLWSRLGYAASMRLAVRLGYVGAIALGAMGLVMGNFMLVFIALFGGVTCYVTHRQLAFTQEMMGFAPDEYAENLYDAPARERQSSPRRRRRAARRAALLRQESNRVDAVLKKIAESGMRSLTWAEKRLLKKATKSKRRLNEE